MTDCNAQTAAMAFVGFIVGGWLAVVVNCWLAEREKHDS